MLLQYLKLLMDLLCLNAQVKLQLPAVY